MAGTIRSASIYAEQLHSRGRGIPLWYPEPSEGVEVEIGDVGFLYDGGFHRLFNATVPEDHDWNAGGVPDHFEPISLPLTRPGISLRRNDLPQGLLKSSSIKGMRAAASLQGQVPGQPVGAGLSYDFEINSHQGAVLILKDQATRKVAIAQLTFQHYMKTNLKDWCAFAHSKGLPYKEEDLLFVNGWTKTTSWHLAAFYQGSRVRAGAVRGQISAVVGAEVVISMLGSDSVAVEERWGPDKRYQLPNVFTDPVGVDSPGDQCIFLVAYRARRRFAGFGGFKIEAAAGPHRLPDPGNDNHASETAVLASPEEPQDEVQPGSFSFEGPCDLVLNYILKNSNAEIALVSEVDIDDLFCGEDWPEDIAKYLGEYLPEIEVEDGVGRLSLKAAVRRARMQETQTQGQSADIDNDASEKKVDAGVQIVEDGVLEVHGGSPNAKTMTWPHIVLRDLLQEVKTLTCMSVFGTGPFVAAGSEEGYVGIWDYKAGKLEHRHKEHEESVWAVAISHDGTKVAAGGADRVGIIWDIEGWYKMSVLDGHEADIVSIAWSPDGKFIVTGSVDLTACLWNPETGELLHSFEEHEAAVLVVGFSPDSKHVVTFGEAVGRIWDTHSGDLLQTLSGHEATIWWMSFSPDGDRIATCSEDGTTRIWSVETGDELVTFHEHGGPVYSVAFSPDGAEIASGSFDETIVTCDSFSGDRHHTFDKHLSAVNTLTYSHSGRFIASGSSDGYVKVWDTLTGDFVAEFRGHEDKVKIVAFSWDDMEVLSSSEEGSIRVWSLRDALRFV